MKLLEVAFPLYKLNNYPPSQIDGVTFYLKGEEPRIVDDRNIPGDSLAIRRLKLHMDKVKLFKLKYAIFYVADLVKLGTPTQWFIDSSGKVFTYTKSRMVPLVFREITNVQRGAAFCIIEAKGINGRHKSLYPPTNEQKYAGFLQISAKAFILYGYFTEKHEDTRRKV